MSRGKPLYVAPTPGLQRVPDWEAAQGAPGGARRFQEVVWAKEPLAVWVWLVMGMNSHQSYRAEAEALCWTVDQVWVRYLDLQGREGWVWVWANAVKRR
jgi:hypothetical protein